jgi:hypothetical protein
MQTTAPVLYQALSPGALQKGEEFLTERPVAEPEPVGCE